MIDYNPVQSTPFTKRIKVKARLWRIVWLLLYRPTPWFMNKFRIFLLNVFGADVSYKATISNSAMIEYPWNLTMDDFSSVGEKAWIYCLDKITIEQYACIGQYSKLVTGTHNYRSEGFELETKPITIGKGAWLTCDVFLLPGVTIGSYAVVGARSLVTKDIPSNSVAHGVPCKVVGNRFNGDMNE